MARATNSCTPHGGSQGGRRESSLLTFGTFGHSKVQEKKSIFKIKDKSPSPVNSQNKRYVFYPLFLLHMQAQKKKLSKRKRRNEISRSAERDEDYACPRLGDADTHASHMCQSPRLGDADTHASHMCQSPDCAAFPKRRAKTLIEGKTSKCMQKSPHRKQNLPAENPQGDLNSIRYAIISSF